MRAAIDIGSNSIRLLILDDENHLHSQRVEETRLGNCFADNTLTEEAMENTLAVLDNYSKGLSSMGVTDVTYIATCALRQAKNSNVFLERARRDLNIAIRVLSGEEEAFYTFTGATGAFPFPASHCCLLDIGGGSTELAYLRDGAICGSSAPVGAVRYQVTHLKREDVRTVIQQHLPALPSSQPYEFIGVGGTITTAATIIKNVDHYSREAIHGTILDEPALRSLQEKLINLSLAERKRLTGMPPKRADIIIYGLDILSILFEIYQIKQIHVSDCGILDGVLSER